MVSRLDIPGGNKVFVNVIELSEVIGWDLSLCARIPVRMGSERKQLCRRGELEDGESHQAWRKSPRDQLC